MSILTKISQERWGYVSKRKKKINDGYKRFHHPIYFLTKLEDTDEDWYWELGERMEEIDEDLDSKFSWNWDGNALSQLVSLALKNPRKKRASRRASQVRRRR